MEIKSMRFKARAAAQIADAGLQANLNKVRGKFVDKRRLAIAEFSGQGGDFEALREAGKELRNRVLADLDRWEERRERNATTRRGTVLQ